MFNGIDKPERTYTLEDFIGFKAQDNMTYYNFSIFMPLWRIVDRIGKE